MNGPHCASGDTSVYTTGVASFQIVTANGHRYPRIVESFRDPITRRPKLRVLRHLGRADDALTTLAQAEQVALASHTHGSVAAVWQLAQSLDLAALIDAHVPPGPALHDGLTVGQSLTPARRKPLFEGPLAFAGTRAAEEIFDADVLIEIRPVDPFTSPDETPVITLDWRASRQARVPRDWYRDTATVRKVHRQGIDRDLHPLGHGWPVLNRRSSPPSSSAERSRVHAPS